MASLKRNLLADAVAQYRTQRDEARAEVGRLVEQLAEVTGRLTLAEIEVGRLDGLRRESRQLLLRMVKAVRKSRDAVSGFALVKLDSLADVVDDYLKRTGEPTDILRGEAQREDTEAETIRAEKHDEGR